MAQLIKSTEVPNMYQAGWNGGHATGPRVRLYRGGILYFSVAAAEIIGTKDCRVLVEYDEENQTLKITAMVKGKLPKGITEEDGFPMRIRPSGPSTNRPIGLMSMTRLGRHLKFPRPRRGWDFEVIKTDAKERSVTIKVPDWKAVMI